MRGRAGAAPAHRIPGLAAGASAAVRGAEPGLTSMTEAASGAGAGLGERCARARTARPAPCCRPPRSCTSSRVIVEALESEDLRFAGRRGLRARPPAALRRAGRRDRGGAARRCTPARPHADSTPDLSAGHRRASARGPGRPLRRLAARSADAGAGAGDAGLWALRSRPVDTDAVVVQTPPADAAATPAAGVQGRRRP